MENINKKKRISINNNEEFLNDNKKLSCVYDGRKKRDRKIDS